MPRDRSKIISVGTHAPNIPTGFGRVSMELCNYIGQFYQTYAIGWQFQGLPLNTPNFTLCPTAPGGNFNEFGQITFPQHIPWARTQVLFTLADWFVFATGAHGHATNWLPNYLLHNVPRECGMPSPKWVWYFPIDSTPLSGGFKRLLYQCEYPVAMAQFGYDVCKDAGIDVTLIPHGVNPEKFKPIVNDEQRTAMKQLLTQRLQLHTYNPPIDLKDKFIFFWNGRNQLRKNPQTVLEAAGKFLERTKATDAYFIIHSTMIPGEVGFTLPTHMERYGLNYKNTSFTNAGSVYIPADEFLIEIMQACDCYFDASGGEGFGFSRIESAAVGMSRIMPHYTTGCELMGEKPILKIEDTYTDRRKDGVLGLKKTKYGFLVPTMEKWTHGLAADHCMPDVEYMVDAMVYCYEHRDENRRMGINSREFAVDNYRWEKILPKWKDLFDQVFADIDKQRAAEQKRNEELRAIEAQQKELMEKAKGQIPSIDQQIIKSCEKELPKTDVKVG